MRFIRFLTSALPICVLMVSMGCTDAGTTTGSEEDLPADQQAEIQAMRDAYTSPGREGPASSTPGASGDESGDQNAPE